MIKFLLLFIICSTAFASEFTRIAVKDYKQSLKVITSSISESLIDVTATLAEDVILKNKNSSLVLKKYTTLRFYPDFKLKDVTVQNGEYQIKGLKFNRIKSLVFHNDGTPAEVNFNGKINVNTKSSTFTCTEKVRFYPGGVFLTCRLDQKTSISYLHQMIDIDSLEFNRNGTFKSFSKIDSAKVDYKCNSNSIKTIGRPGQYRFDVNGNLSNYNSREPFQIINGSTTVNVKGVIVNNCKYYVEKELSLGEKDLIVDSNPVVSSEDVYSQDYNISATNYCRRIGYERGATAGFGNYKLVERDGRYYDAFKDKSVELKVGTRINYLYSVNCYKKAPIELATEI